jgi:uncharacterized protein (DUF433 family)
MALTMIADSIPLTMDKHGSYRVGESGVRLDTVLYAFNSGSSPEQIVKEFPSVELADVHLIIGHYLRHRDEVNRYLEENARRAGEIRKKLEEEGFTPKDTKDFRARLLERWNSRA